MLLVETHLEIKKSFNELFVAVQSVAAGQGFMPERRL